MPEEPQPPLEEAANLIRHLLELLHTQTAATGAQVSARLLPTVLQLQDAIRRADR